MVNYTTLKAQQKLLMLEGTIATNAIPDYLAYTQKINRMFGKFEWETVLMFDREYRQFQATVDMRCTVDIRHLSDIDLGERPNTDTCSMVNEIAGRAQVTGTGLATLPLKPG